jgi:hypothetical protein
MSNAKNLSRYLRKLFHYDCRTGKFTRLNNMSSNARVGGIAGGYQNTGYIAIHVSNTLYLAHRLAWVWMTGKWPSEIDHRNGNRSDNTWANLRQVTRSVNNQNQRRAHLNSRTGVLGVAPNGKTSFQANIQVNGKPHYLGTFRTIEAARAAYLKAKSELHPGSTI